MSVSHTHKKLFFAKYGKSMTIGKFELLLEKLIFLLYDFEIYIFFTSQIYII